MGTAIGSAVYRGFFIPRAIARAVRDFVTVGGSDEPWALQMARECGQFTQSGENNFYYALERYPRPGGWHEQDDREMAALWLAARAAMVYRKTKWTAEDAEFIAWVNRGETK